MGLTDLFSRERAARSALEAAEAEQPGDGAVDRLVRLLLDVGIDGRGPVDSARAVADAARRESRSTEDAVRKVARGALVGGGVGGFVTGLGGFVTMPVALPANVAEFYLQATRMVAAIASLRGYDLADPRIRTAVLLTLVGAKSEDVLRKAGITTVSGRATSLALRNLPPAALMVLNKAIGFRLVRGVGERALTRLGRGVPVAGGVVGGGLDVWMMKRIADHAMAQFPPADPRSPGAA